MKKLWGLFVCIVIALNVSVLAYADNGNKSVLTGARFAMNNAEFKNYVYNWEDIFKASRPIFTDGILSGRIDDFDSDGSLEMLVIKLSNSYDNDGIYAKVKLEMYESTGNNAILTASTENFKLISQTTDAGGLECFVKNSFIVLQCAEQNNTFADGADQTINIFSYDGNNFKTELSYSISGSSMSFEDDETTPQSFRQLGFTETASYFSQTAFSPYFIFSDYDTGVYSFDDCTNLAKLEKDITPIFELLITNNGMELLKANNNIQDYNKLFVDNEVMKITTNDYTNIEEEITVLINNKKVEFDQPPYIENGTTRVPMRKIFESLGAEVEYEAAAEKITAVKDGTIIELLTGSSTALINGKSTSLAEPVVNKNGFTMLPLRFVAEALGAEVAWDSSSKIISINLL